LGPQIRKLFRDDMFNNLLQGDEKKAWDAFRLVSTNSLGHPNPLIRSIGNYSLADFHRQYKKYIQKRPKHILL